MASIIVTGILNDNMCRACMMQRCLFVDMFNAAHQDDPCEYALTFAEMFGLICAPIKISKDDALPLKLCYTCKAKLQSAFDFRNKCQEVDNTLRTTLSMENYPPINNIKDIRQDFKDEFKDCGNLIDPLLVIVDNDEDNIMISEDNTIDTNIELVCEYCRKDFEQLDALMDHLKRDHNLIFKCLICLKLFLNNNQLNEHITNVHDDVTEIFKCFKCPKKFISRDLLARHDITHMLNANSNNKNLDVKFRCSECDAEFDEKFTLFTHMKIHAKKAKKVDTCKICNKTMLAHSLRRHLATHSADKPFKCNKCDSQFTRREFLVDHIQVRHIKVQRDPLVPPVYKCRFCNEVFEMRKLLRTHLINHSGDMPHLCPQCGKTFMDKFVLTDHLTTHSQLKPFNCHLCPKQFRSKPQLTTHVKIHKGTSNKLTCQICFRGCRNAYRLRVHMRLHTSVKQFGCDICTSRFYSDEQLNKHRKLHSGEMSYSCKHCEETFPNYKRMLAHSMKAHLGVNIYECTICKEKFRLRRELTQHYPTHYVDPETEDLSLKRDSDDSLYENLEVLDENFIEE